MFGLGKHPIEVKVYTSGSSEPKQEKDVNIKVPEPQVEEITESNQIIAGSNIRLENVDGKVRISSIDTKVTTIKSGGHVASGESIELEAGPGVVINTSHPNKIKISVQIHPLLADITARLEKLEQGVQDGPR